MLEECNGYLNTHLSSIGDFESVYNADGGYIWNNKDVKYPSVCFEILSINRTDETTVFNYRVTAAARQHESVEPSTQENYNMLYTALEKAFSEMEQPEIFNEGFTFNVSAARNYSFAPLKLMDVCAVCSVDIQIIGFNEECV